MSFQRSSVHTLNWILALCLVAAPALAQKKGNRANDARRHTTDAATVFDEIMSSSDSSIPKELVDKGTSSLEHLRENLQAAALELPSNAIAELNAIYNGLAEGQSMS